MKHVSCSVFLSLHCLHAAMAPVPVAARGRHPRSTQAVSWLESQQQPDGGFAGFGGKTDPGTTADVALALGGGWSRSQHSFERWSVEPSLPSMIAICNPRRVPTDRLQVAPPS